jgi:cellulose synthase/poly-beta-1,6-N-acetylglucosamine synthase-like glycosyltransferase
MRNKKIKLIKNAKRIGQQLSQNKILNQFKSEVVVLIEADMVLATDTSLSELIKPMTQDKKVGMALGRAISLRGETFFEKIMVAGQDLKGDIFTNWKEGVNIFSAGGHSMKALSSDFATQLTWPDAVPEDAYTYLKAVELGVVIERNPKATAYMRNVTTPRDRLKQCKKYHTGKLALTKEFDSELIKNEYKIPAHIALKGALKHLIKNPLFTPFYLIEAGVNRVLTNKKDKFNALYEPYYTSKTLTLL